MDKLEKKFGRLAVPHCTLVLLAIQAVGYVFYYAGGSAFLTQYFTLDPYAVLHGQVWRIITWLMVPSLDVFSFLLVAVLFYYPIGTQMERAWGDFRYTLYIFLGLFFTLLGSFLLYAYYYVRTGGEGLYVTAVTEIGVGFARGGMARTSAELAAAFSPYFVMLSIFFAFAATFPESTVLFMFLIPVKMKWMGIGYGVYLIYLIATGDVIQRVVIIASVLNFAVFFLWSRGSTFQRYTPKEIKRRQSFQQSVRMEPKGLPRHRCAVCNATEMDHPEYEFRYCSKCNGAYEYCQEHLFTHSHIS